MSQHTPGPWKVKTSELTHEGLHIVTEPGGLYIGSVHPEPDGDKRIQDECRANARLIAAAPEMLALIRKLGAVYDTPGKVINQCFPLMAEARALLAKIEERA